MTTEGMKIEYGLKWNPNPPLTVPQFVAYALVTGVYTILAWISVVSVHMMMSFALPETFIFTGSPPEKTGSMALTARFSESRVPP